LVPSPSGVNTHGRKGVWWAISTWKWVTTITKGRKRVHLGHFDRSADSKSNVQRFKYYFVAYPSRIRGQCGVLRDDAP
jgi:hypothetical protein